MADHKRFTLATDIDVCFCDPHSPWQRGSNENTNELLRQYFPKGVDIATYSQDQLNEVARTLNERPRTLEYRTPAERFSQLVALTCRIQDPERLLTSILNGRLAARSYDTLSSGTMRFR